MDNRAILYYSYDFFKRNLKVILLSILLISVIASLTPFIEIFLFPVLLGIVMFFIRDNEFTEDKKIKNIIEFTDIKHYFKYGLSFSILFFVIWLIITILISILSLILFLIFVNLFFEQTDYFGNIFLFIISVIISTIFVYILLFPVYFLLPIYINLILSATSPIEVLKVNIKLFTKEFWDDILEYIKKKEFLKSSLIWSVVSISILTLSLIFILILDIIILKFIPTNLLTYIGIGILNIFIIELTTLFLCVYLVYLGHFIKLKIR